MCGGGSPPPPPPPPPQVAPPEDTTLPGGELDVSEQEGEGGKVPEAQARKDEKDKNRKEGTANTQKDPNKDKKGDKKTDDVNTGGNAGDDLNI